MSWFAPLLALGGGLFAVSALSKPSPGLVDQAGPPAGKAPPKTGSLPFALSSLEKDILIAAKQGKLEFKWTTLPAAPDVEVTTDAVKLDGVRFPVTARLAQWVCDILGDDIRLTTPWVEDFIEEGAVKRVVSPTYDYRKMHTAAAVEHFNAGLDAQLQGYGERQLVGCVGKSWVLVRALEMVPGVPSPSKNATRDGQGMLITDGMPTAVNYGMFRPDGPYTSVTGKYKLWQQPGYAHNIAHWDYSQVLRLCRPRYAGVKIPGDTALARQPGVGKVQA